MKKKKTYFNPRNDEKISTIIENVEACNICVRFEKGNFKTADCLIAGKRVLLLNKNLKPVQMIDFLRNYLIELQNA